MTNYSYEYRINKKGAECFRTTDYEHARARLDDLQAKHGRIYTMQYRTCPKDRYGRLMTDCSGKPIWSIWH